MIDRSLVGVSGDAAEGETIRRSSLRVIASDIKIAHSVFALPFAILAAFMAAMPAKATSSTGHLDWLRFGSQLLLIILAMFFARSAAMLANRWLDREIDSRNPRTAGRALPSGRLTSRAALLALIACAIAFLAACACFGWMYANWLPLMLALPVLLWISAYGYLKRFTALCHLYLGSSLAISPLAAAIAIDPQAITQQAALWLMAGMVLCWVAGFDIIYALQDVEIDRAQNLHSIPARLGMANALWVSRLLHGVAAACLFAAALIDDRFGAVFFAGCVIVASLLIYEHLTVSRWGTTKMALAFFALNGIISCLLGALGIIDLALI